MVRSHLKVLISRRSTERLERGEKAITVRGLAEETGLPISVINSLRQNASKRVDLQTLNSLCKALECQVGDILVYSPDEPDKDAA